jgi:pimeloyl-ACP methyl ester carboxylesterase
VSVARDSAARLIDVTTASSSRARGLAIVATASSLLLLLSGCFFGGPEPETTSKPTGEAVDESLKPYYEQVLTWSDCENGMQCTTAIAPMDWSNPSPETDIELALVRQPATGSMRLGSLFTNPGGPGASGFDFVYDSVDFAASEDLQAAYDVVGWDPRGVGRSAPVKCYDGPQLDEFIYGLPEAPRGTQAWIDEVTQASIDFGQACLANTGPVLQFIDTQSTVHDLDMLRAVVGDEKLNYFGYSYGSDIGSYYVENFPDKVGRIVVDGATDSSISVFDVGLTQTAGFQLALENYLTACPDLFDDCPFTAGVDAALAQIRALYDRYDANPIPGADGRLMDAGVIDIAMSMALYSKDSWEYLNDLFSEAEEGITDTAFFLADYYYSRDTDGTYADNSLEAFLAIYCVDYPVETDPAVLTQQEVLLQQASPTTYRPSPPIGDVTCINWPFSYAGPPITALTGKGAAPILVVSTTGDPATPYEWGVALSEQLESAQLITFNGEGHTAYGQGNACIIDTVDSYFLKGTVPESDPDC